MNWDDHKISKAHLIAKHLQGTLSGEEMVEFQAWLASDPENKALVQRLEASKQESLQFLSSLDVETAWDSVVTRIHPAVRFPAYWRFMAAAVAVLLLGYGIYRYTYMPESHPGEQLAAVTGEDFAPGSDKALLTLQNGAVLVLEDLPEGRVEQENGVILSKKEGLLSYHPEADAEEAPVAYHTVSTPVGGRFQLVLPDSSKVWLNSASSIRFPTRFAGNERRVTLTGEAFFEVTSYSSERHRKMPFRVEAGQGTVEVLGTQFNITAYEDEPAVKTSLLEGAVKVTGTQGSRNLVPGQQAVLHNGISVRQVDLEEVTAWKNGYFQFENKPLGEILKQLQRWYGVGVETGTIPPGKHFTASISRDKSLSSVLRMLELSGDLHFEIQNKQIRITEKSVR